MTDRLIGVIGVDTHRDTHTASALSAAGGVIAHVEQAAHEHGYRQLVDFGIDTLPEARCWAIEGTGSYGAGLTRFLQDLGEKVVEVERPKRPTRRSHAKSDQIDAVRAARQALADDGLSEPKQGSAREALRVLLATRKGAVTSRVELEKSITSTVTEIAPHLLERCGIGALTAARVIVAWSHPGRFRSEAAFAALAGVAPIEASSGQTERHRLNRGGDRLLNSAIHTIVLIRVREDPETKEYVARRTAEGKSPREIRRCLKRCVARQLHRGLTAQPPTG